MIIIPKGIFAQYLTLRLAYNKQEAMQRMTNFRHIKKWLMAGNPMLLDDCVAKCERWKRKFEVKYSVNQDRNRIEVEMSQLHFSYSWKEKKTFVDLKTTTHRGEQHFELNGKCCCNLDRVFTLNERLEFSLDFPQQIQWLEDNGILDEKIRDLKALEKQIDWWSHVLCMYAYVNLCLLKTSSLKARKTDDHITIKSSFNGLYRSNLRFLGSNPKELDRHFAERFLPLIQSRLETNETYRSYLAQKSCCIPVYTRESQPKEFDDYFTNIDEKYRTIYNLLFDAAQHLGMKNEYGGSDFFYFCFNTDYFPDALFVRFHSHLRSNDARFKLNFKETDWKQAFWPFWHEVQQCALEMLDEKIAHDKEAIRMIKEKIE